MERYRERAQETRSINKTNRDGERERKGTRQLSEMKTLESETSDVGILGGHRRAGPGEAEWSKDRGIE